MPYLRLYYHLVWSTRDRLPLIGEHEEELIRRSFKMTCDDLKLIPYAFGFMPDHVHAAITIPSTVTLAETIRRLKGASSNAVNKFSETQEERIFSWQGEYGALTHGDRALPYVVSYVNSQKERHQSSRIVDKMERFESPD